MLHTLENRWGVLFYYMLNINAMMQCTTGENDEMFEWLMHTVTDSADLTSNASDLDQFVIAVEKIRADSGSLSISDPNADPSRTIFWDKIRTSCKPNSSPFFANIDFIALRLEPCIAVIKTVLQRNFSAKIIMRLAKAADWVQTDHRANFYDIQTRGWPLKKSEYDEETQQVISRPWPESDLTPSMMKWQRCLFFRADQWNKICNGYTSASPDVDYKTIEIKSANTDLGTYVFYDEVSGGGWFGYRAACQSTYGKMCGGTNFVYVGSPTSDLRYDVGTEVLNEVAGHGDLATLYNVQTIRKWFGYSLDPRVEYPPGYTTLAFIARNGESDVPITEQRDWTSFDTVSKADSPDNEHEDDEQDTGGSCPQQADEVVGSSPLRDISNKRGIETASGQATLRKPKARRISLLDDEAEGSDDGDDEVNHAPRHTHLSFTLNATYTDA